MPSKNHLIKKIEILQTSDLKPYKKNARTHSNQQIKQLAESIKNFGFNNPILIDEKNTIIAGHCRLEAAKSLGRSKVPCLRLNHLNKIQKRAFVLADNKLALNAGWDYDLLADEIQGLAKSIKDLDFDLNAVGFTFSEVDLLLENTSNDNSKDDELFETGRNVANRCAYGDIWQLGSHRLLCGNSLDPKMVACLMDGKKATMVFTDPPYNVPVNGHVRTGKKSNFKEFAFASGEMSSTEFINFLKESFANLTKNSVDGSIHFICIDWRHISELQTAAGSLYSELKNLIVWVKDNGGMGSFYRSQHELIFAYKNGVSKHINNFELGQHGRYRTNVWCYSGVNSFSANRHEELNMHPTVKPVQLIVDAIKDVSGRGDIILDLFAGSGSTLIAADKSGRRAYLCEVDPHYCDVTLARFEKHSSKQPILITNIFNKKNGGDTDA